MRKSGLAGDFGRYPHLLKNFTVRGKKQLQISQILRRWRILNANSMPAALLPAQKYSNIRQLQRNKYERAGNSWKLEDA